MGTKTREETTVILSDRIWRNTSKLGVYRCPEVTINRERVDFLTYTHRGKIWRFYEVKSCKEDFYSNAKWTFLGHYNYFVMEHELYEQVKHDIPDFVGVTNGNHSFKKAKKQELQVDHDDLMWCFMRSLSTQLNTSKTTIKELSRENKGLRSTQKSYAGQENGY